MRFHMPLSSYVDMISLLVLEDLNTFPLSCSRARLALFLIFFYYLSLSKGFFFRLSQLVPDLL